LSGEHSNGIPWREKISAAYKEAAQQNSLVLIDFFNPG